MATYTDELGEQIANLYQAIGLNDGPAAVTDALSFPVHPCASHTLLICPELAPAMIAPPFLIWKSIALARP